MSRVTSLYVCYWSLTDPLCQTQSLAYLRQLTARGHRFALMTFEQSKYRLSPAEAEARRRELEAEGIHWYPLTYHKRHPLLATGYDCALGVARGAWIALKHRARVVHSRASIPAAIALGVSTLCRLPFLYDADSRLSEEYADNGHWSRESRAFKVTAWVERTARNRADSIVVLSDALRREFVEYLGVTAPIEVIPCCVDMERFRRDEAARESRRAELGIGAGERLFVYVGKLGPRYLVDESFAFFVTARARTGPARLLVLSGDPAEGFREAAARHGLGTGDVEVRSARPNEVPGWLSAADVGLALIRSAGCERGASPVKIGEYLAVGLPVVITPGIGDYSGWIDAERLGVVVGELSTEGYAVAADALAGLWSEGAALGRRCREAAGSHVALDGIGAVRYETVYKRIL